ncbi:MAG: hypothetical protein H5T50_10655, partial [Nitrososphaeria archaeon]|nr:hypothetical protein [Nitrososphaeria archaeon]
MKLKVFISVSIILLPYILPADAEIYEEINKEMLEYYLTKICNFGVRYTGRNACADAEEWVYNEFLSMGLEVKKFKWEMGGFE